MPHPHKLTLAQVSEIQDRVARGELQPTVARDYGVTASTVRRNARRFGLPPLVPRKSTSARRLTPAEQVELVAAFRVGTPHRELRERYGISRHALTRVLKRHIPDMVRGRSKEDRRFVLAAWREYRDGVSTSEIVRRFDFRDRRAIYHAFDRHGLYWRRHGTLREPRRLKLSPNALQLSWDRRCGGETVKAIAADMLRADTSLIEAWQRRGWVVRREKPEHPVSSLEPKMPKTLAQRLWNQRGALSCHLANGGLEEVEQERAGGEPARSQARQAGR